MICGRLLAGGDRIDQNSRRNNWYDELAKRIKTLGVSPQRFALAPESAKLGVRIRQMLFGVSAKPTHRVLYLVDNDEVTVLRVLHCSQDRLRTTSQLQ